MFSRIGPAEADCDRKQFEAEEFNREPDATVFTDEFPPRR